MCQAFIFLLFPKSFFIFAHNKTPLRTKMRRGVAVNMLFYDGLFVVSGSAWNQNIE